MNDTSIGIKFIGSSVFSKEQANQRVSAIFIHNEFDPVSLKHDIAVIRVRNIFEKYFRITFFLSTYNEYWLQQMEQEQFDNYNTNSLKSATLQKETVQDKTLCQIAGFYLPSLTGNL